MRTEEIRRLRDTPVRPRDDGKIPGGYGSGNGGKRAREEWYGSGRDGDWGDRMRVETIAHGGMAPLRALDSGEAMVVARVPSDYPIGAYGGYAG